VRLIGPGVVRIAAAGCFGRFTGVGPRLAVPEVDASDGFEGLRHQLALLTRAVGPMAGCGTGPARA
jgi:hypothetical protein